MDPTLSQANVQLHKSNRGNPFYKSNAEYFGKRLLYSDFFSPMGATKLDMKC